MKNKKLMFIWIGKGALVLMLVMSACWLAHSQPVATNPAQPPAATSVAAKSAPSAPQQDECKPVCNADLVKLIIEVTAGGLAVCYVGSLWAITKRGKLFEPYLGHGLLLQTIVVILIAECVLALAIAGILHATEVGTIYGGITGYILGKTVPAGEGGGNGAEGGGAGKG